jgi:hypothetical protein
MRISDATGGNSRCLTPKRSCKRIKRDAREASYQRSLVSFSDSLDGFVVGTSRRIVEFELTRTAPSIPYNTTDYHQARRCRRLR